MLVGRQRELTLLGERIARDRSVALVGTAGVGKTVLLREAARTSGREVFEGGALANLAWMSFLPLARALREALPRGDDPAVAAFVRERVGDGLLVLDDLHWADLDTLSLLPVLTATGVTLVAAVRSGDTGTRTACAALREANVDPLELEELQAEDATALVRSEHPDIDQDSLAQILRAAGGNPFLLAEFAASPEPSPTLRLSLRARLDRCSADARRSMSLLALLGRAATRDLVGQAVDELVDAGLVNEHEDGFEPRHALLAESAIEGLDDESTRRELHASLAQALSDEAESARHHAAAGERDRALTKALNAAERAERPGERASHLGLAASCASGRDADELRLNAADALLDAGRFEEAGALAAAVESRNVETRARACLLRGRAHWARGEREDAIHELDAGIALVRGRGHPVEARLELERLRDDLAFGGSDVLEKAQRAWSIAQAAGAESALADFTLGVALCWYACSDACLPVFKRSVEAAESEGYDLWFTAVEGLCSGLQMFQQSDRLDRLQADMATHGHDLGLRRWELHFTWMRGQNAYLHGEYGQAIKWLRSCLADPAMAQPDRDQVAADLATSLADTGRAEEALGLIEQAQGTAGTPWGSFILLTAESEAAWLAGQPRRALAAADKALAGLFFEAMRPQVVAERDWALLDLNRPTNPPSELEPMPFYAGYQFDSQALSAISTSPSSAERLFLAAAEAYRGNILRNELRSLWAAADIAVREGAVARGRRSLLELEQQAEASGLVPVVARIRRSLRKAGVRRSAPRGANAAALTEREREVLRLVAAGLTSREIALNLGLARSTIESAVRSAMSKLDAKTRMQAAALAGNG